jgi:putative tricarboxylic transport membrane protein
MFDVELMIVFGIIGYLMKKLGIPIAPVVLGLVLGPILEDNFRRSLIITHGDFFTFFKRPISLILIILVIIFLFFPFLKKVIQKYL